MVGLEWWVIPLLMGLAASGRLGWRFITEILGGNPRSPAWLEGAAPLKGRWLWLLLSMPMVLAAMGIMFVAVAGPVAAIAMVFNPEFNVYGGIGLLAYCGICWVFRSELNTRRRSSKGSR